MSNAGDKPKDAQHEALQRAAERARIRAQYPADMGFHPLSAKFTDNPDAVKAPWLAAYFRYRNHHATARRQELYEILAQIGADNSEQIDRFRGALLGLAIGDALGTTLEFADRDSAVVTDMVGGGPFRLQPGDWTDDTSMACCLAYSLIRCDGFDADDAMLCFSYWYRFGAYSPTGTCFDIGVTTRAAIERYLSTGEPIAGSTSPNDAGNGSLMRLAPVVLRYASDFEACVHFAAESSRLTHGAPEAVDACRYFAALLWGALSGVPKDVLLRERYAPIASYWDRHPLSPAVDRIAHGSYKRKHRDEISSSGYVIHTLEAALWAFFHYDGFEPGLLAAVNLAGDADTVGAVFGQLGGAYGGETSLPIKWIIRTYGGQGFYHFAQELLALSKRGR
ncbi:ADP-ribosylglycohydrolase family protein [Trinickia caryophylli]|uniref:ADP-ribosylglycohydrolase n=1 Tax=Trinickia caryophylli TaxID=28094 RepID=A0A1X7H2Z5_TRICW|nr:ADP-ribosylglycohydrolase family protein [Trinickia caryophylli]PMS10047.1 ADP-ribosylglycohydrolase family protein [Trinickia caryophylli]TRX18404.1 ADP-ribosylglycohydrolase family protein [Trinickia caryophylli]WQE10813.1 ADP-ribosylglycohydrolase family protein [Trinickia caryophylli]SMF78656.1 ADP-ribosylglycohydrolase [Trinickia caryophylli]GLU35891.1 ADP-ribosylglycohydrolase [Trinickia caryophylli]